MPNSKIVFLDIDGVLNSKRTPNPRGFPYIVDPKLLDRYVRLAATTGAKTVLLSTWRHDPAGRWAARYYGVPFTDVIPDMPHSSRGDEIRAWLEKHPEVSRYAILDDEDDGLDDLPVFQPSARIGLTQEIADCLAGYLNGETDDCRRRNWFVRQWQNVRSFFRRDES
jgi:hypothetical protein